MAVNAVLVAVNRVVFELAVCLHDQAAAEVGDVVALGADALAARFIAMARVDQLHLARAVGRLVLGAYPNIGGNARVHKLVGAELYDCVEPVVLQHIAANLAGTALGVARKQRRAVLDDCHLAVGSHLG